MRRRAPRPCGWPTPTPARRCGCSTPARSRSSARRRGWRHRPGRTNWGFVRRTRPRLAAGERPRRLHPALRGRRLRRRPGRRRRRPPRRRPGRGDARVRRSRDVWIGAALLAVAAAGIGLLVQSPRTAGPPYRLDGHGTLGLSGLGAGLRGAGFGVDERLSPTIPDHGLIVSVGATVVQPRRGGGVGAVDPRRARSCCSRPTTATRSPRRSACGFGPPAEVRPTAAGRRAFPGLSADGVTAAATFGRLPRGAVALVGDRDSRRRGARAGREGKRLRGLPAAPADERGHRRRRPRDRASAGAGRRGRRRSASTRSTRAARRRSARSAYLPAVGAARDPRGRGDRDPGRPGRGPPPRSRGPRRGHDDPNDRRARPVAGRRCTARPGGWPRRPRPLAQRLPGRTWAA